MATKKILLDRILNRVGLCRVSRLDLLPDVAKRLDEHRELTEAIAEHTDLLKREPWRAIHLKTQDEYLAIIFELVHGFNSEENMRMARYVRDKPILSDGW